MSGLDGHRICTHCRLSRDKHTTSLLHCPTGTTRYERFRPTVASVVVPNPQGYAAVRDMSDGIAVPAVPGRVHALCGQEWVRHDSGEHCPLPGDEATSLGAVTTTEPIPQLGTLANTPNDDDELWLASVLDLDALADMEPGELEAAFEPPPPRTKPKPSERERIKAKKTRGTSYGVCARCNRRHSHHKHPTWNCPNNDGGYHPDKYFVPVAKQAASELATRPNSVDGPTERLTAYASPDAAHNGQNLFCPRGPECVDHAIGHGWLAFTCRPCKHFSERPKFATPARRVLPEHVDEIHDDDHDDDLPGTRVVDAGASGTTPHYVAKPDAPAPDDEDE